MFCSSCGLTVDEKLNFCKNCGAKIIKSAEDTPATMFNALLTTLSMTVLGALGILVGLSVALLKNGFDQKYIAIIAVFYLATLTESVSCFSVSFRRSSTRGFRKPKTIPKIIPSSRCRREQLRSFANISNRSRALPNTRRAISKKFRAALSANKKLFN